MKKFYLYCLLCFLFIFNSASAQEIVEIHAEEKSECTNKHIRKFLQSIEQSKEIIIHCIYNNVRYLTNGETLIEQDPRDKAITLPFPPPPLPSAIPPTRQYTEWKTYFATDRAFQSNANPYKQFTNEIYKGEHAYQMGEVIVTIPLNKKIGTSTVKGFVELKNNPSKHTILKHNEILSPTEFYKRIQQNPNKKAFIFIHGYNVSFANAAMQTAELAHDLNFIGTPIFYSWPSKARLISYKADQETIASSQNKFASFIRDFVEKSPQEIYLIAHSMGSEALLKTIRTEFPNNPKLQQHVKGVIFVAPDVATKDFRQTIHELQDFKIPVTLYGSEKDLALAVSEKLNNYPRAGFLKPLNQLVGLNELDVIDASNVRTDFLGHSLSPLAMDIRDLMGRYSKANQRSRLKPINYEQWTYFNLPSLSNAP